MSRRKRPPENGKALIPVSGTDGGSKVPALKSTNFHANFLALIAACDEQVTLYNEFCILYRGRNKPVDLSYESDAVDDARELWTSVREGAEQCLAYMNALWAESRLLKEPHKNIPNADYLYWRVTRMAKAWPDAVKWEKEDTRYIAERLEVENHNALAWESIFREIEDTNKKPPLLAEVLELLKKTKHIADWKRRLAAIDLATIQFVGEETVFAFEYKKTVFEAATLEYLKRHGCVDLAAAMRDEALSPWECAIEGAAKTEGLLELVAEMESGKYCPGMANDPWKKACDILLKKKHVMLEWSMRINEIQYRLNHDKVFACTGCGAGYKERQNRCMVCGSFSTVVSHAKWVQHIEQKQEELEQKYKLESALSHKQKLIEKLVEQYNDKHYERGKPLKHHGDDRQWMASHIELGKQELPTDHYVEVIHLHVGSRTYDDARSPYAQYADLRQPWIKLQGFASYDLSEIQLRHWLDDMIPKDATTSRDPGFHFLMTCVYEKVERKFQTHCDLKLKQLIPYKYEVIKKEDQTFIVSAFANDDDEEAFYQLLHEETFEEQAQLVELRAKQYATYLPPSTSICALRQLVELRIKDGPETYNRIKTEAERQQEREERNRRFAEERQKAEERREAKEALEDEEEEARLVGWHLAKQERAAKDRFEDWLRSLDLGTYIVDAFHDNDIDEMMLPRLTHEHLKEIGITSLGHRIKLLDAIAARSNEMQFDGMYDADGQLKS